MEQENALHNIDDGCVTLRNSEALCNVEKKLSHLHMYTRRKGEETAALIAKVSSDVPGRTNCVQYHVYLRRKCHSD